MKKFIHVYQNQIVQRYEAEVPTIFGGPWSLGEAHEVPSDISFHLAEIDEEGNIYERQLSEEELYQNELQECESYVAEIVKGQKAIAYFRLLNDKKGLSAKQKMQLVVDADIQNVIQLLLIGKLPEASAVIDSLEVDGVLITKSDKVKLLRFLGE